MSPEDTIACFLSSCYCFNAASSSFGQRGFSTPADFWDKIGGLHEKFPPRQNDCVFKVKSLIFSSFGTEHWTASQHSVRLRVLLSDPQQFDIHGTCHGGLTRTRSWHHFDWRNHFNFSAVLWLQQIRQWCCRWCTVAEHHAWRWANGNGSGTVKRSFIAPFWLWNSILIIVLEGQRCLRGKLYAARVLFPLGWQWYNLLRLLATCDNHRNFWRFLHCLRSRSY